MTTVFIHGLGLIGGSLIRAIGLAIPRIKSSLAIRTKPHWITPCKWGWLTRRPLASREHNERTLSSWPVLS